MSLENNKKSSHEKQRAAPSIKVDTKNLLNELARKIADEYGIDISKVKDFINSKTGSELGQLKSLVNSETGQQINIEELKSVISGAREVVEKASKEKIEVLKGTIESASLSPETDFYITEKIIPASILSRSENPQNLGDNIVGAGVGFINSSEAVIKLLYQIGSGIVKTPYHIYMVMSGKGEYKNLNRI